MIVVAEPRLTLGAAALMLREAVKDRSYRATPLGLEVARYYRWKKNEWGASEETLRDYEATLRNLCLYFADLELRDLAPPVGTERLRECWDHFWGDRTPRTRAKVRSTWIDFFEWAVRERGLAGNPARALTRPKARDPERHTFGENFVRRALSSQEYVGDYVLCYLVLRYGLRRSGLRNAQLKHFDFEHRELTVYTKGGRVYPIPIVEPAFWRRLGELRLDAGLQPDDFLVYRQDTRRRRVPLELATETLSLAGKLVGYAEVTTREHSSDRPSSQTVHRWWYRCLVRGGLVPEGTTAGANMHRGRHTVGREMQRAHHDLELTRRILGHRDIHTTSIYAELDTADLASALRSMDRDEEDES